MASLERVLAACAVALALSAAAQDYPSRPVRIVAAEAPGSPAAMTARFLADRLAKEWQQDVVVEERPRPTAAESVIGSPADGHTLLVDASPLFAAGSLYRSVRFDPVNDLRPLVGLHRQPLAMVVAANSTARYAKDVNVEAAMRTPGTVAYASPGAGSTAHLAAAWLASIANVQYRHLAYDDPAQEIAALVTGRVHFAFMDIEAAAPHMAGGRLRAVGVTSPRSTKSLPRVPPVSETGYPVLVVEPVTFLAVAAGTPDSVAQKIAATVEQVIRSPEYQGFLDAHALEPDGTPLRAWPAKVSEEAKHWTALVRRTGVRLD